MGGDSGGLWTHDPLPYIVTVRTIVDDDQPSITHEWRGDAYSVFEAMLQATIAAGGAGLEDSRYKVESVMPDAAEWFTRALRRAREAIVSEK